jgi:hypothetical protein
MGWIKTAFFPSFGSSMETQCKGKTRGEGLYRRRRARKRDGSPKKVILMVYKR